LIRVFKVLVVIALAAILIVGLTTSACCDGTAAVPNGDVPNGNTPNGDVNGNPNGDTPNGNEPTEPTEPAAPDLSSGLGLIIDCEEFTGSSFQYGDPAPVFHFEDATGNTFALSDFQGKSVMLNFWRSNCNPCVMEMPHLQEVYDEWQGGEVVILLLNIGEDADTVNEFLDEHGLSLPVILDREAFAAAEYGTYSIPCTFFIDKEGGIRGIKIGAFQSAEELDSILEQLIAL
jgi:cytochrome c biogenesis protein CcmG/thiol:disulfide interchange protein DsbE